MEKLLHFVFWALIEGMFFRIGRTALRLASFNKIRLENPAPVQVFAVAGLGMVLFIPVAIMAANFLLLS